MSEVADAHASRHERRREDGRSPRQRTRRRSEKRSASRSRRRRHHREARSRSRSRSALQRLERLERREEHEPSDALLVRGLLDTGITEERLEAIAWEAAVQAGSSMPNSVRFTLDRASDKVGSAALLEFPHKGAAKAFKEHTGGHLAVDGFNLGLKYHHPVPETSRSRSRERACCRERDEPSVTIMIKGISSTTSEATLAATFQPFATIKDIRHFPRRGFAFVQFHSIEDATLALNRFERDCRSRLDGERVVAHFAKEREDGRQSGAERNFLQQQALVAAEATAELEKLAAQQVQHENTSKALSGVNAEMWASYMQSVAQTETVQSVNTFQYDKDSGYYLDAKAALFYDPNTTYFFSTDCKKYFVYDRDEEMLCLVDAQGQKVADGERRPLPSQAHKSKSREMREAKDSAPQRDREREHERDRDRDRERERERRRSSRSRRRERSRSAGRTREREREHRERDKDRERERRQEPVRPRSPPPDGKPRPIHFPGGDPLARLAPATEQPAAGPKATPQPKKKRRPPEAVLGLASLTDTKAVSSPGPITVFTSSTPKLGPVTVAPSSATNMGICRGSLVQGEQLAPKVGTVTHSATSRVVAHTPGTGVSSTSNSGVLTAVALAGTAGAAGLLPTEEWICEVCMRRFGSKENLHRHEQLSELHRQNMAKLNAAV